MLTFDDEPLQSKAIQGKSILSNSRPDWAESTGITSVALPPSTISSTE